MQNGKLMLSAKSILEVTQSEGSSRTLVGRHEGLKVLGLASLINALLFSLFFAVATPCYETNDDRTMQMIASGFYTGQPSEYLVFTNILIGWPLRILYSHWTGCNWYFAYLVAVHYAALTALVFLVLSRRCCWQFVLLCIGFFLLVETRILTELQFTTTAFLAGTAGVLLLADGLQPRRRAHWPKLIVGVAFIALMGMIRVHVAPLLAIIASPFLLEHFGMRGWRRFCAAGLVCAGLFFALEGFNRWYYQRNPEWAQFAEYNYLRGAIHGTPLTRFVSRAAPAAGWSQNDGDMFTQFYFSDPDVYSLAKLRLFSDRLSAMARSEPRTYAGFSIRRLFLPWMLPRDSRMLMEVAILSAAWCLLAAGAYRVRYSATLLGMYGIFITLCLYLTRTARLPERVAYNLPLFAHALCLYWASGFHNLPTAVSGPNVLNRLLPTFTRCGVLRWATRALVLGFVVLYAPFVYNLGNVVWYVNVNHRRLKVMSRTIFDPVRTLLPPGQKSILVPLPADSFLERSVFFYPQTEKLPFSLVPSYGWLTHSPIFRQNLDEHQLRPFSLSLVDRRDVFFLMGKKWIQPLRTFYREHYGLEVRFDMVLNTDEIPEYRKCYLYLYQAHAVHPTFGVRPIP